VFFQDHDGTAPVAAWLVELRQAEPRVMAVLLHALVKEDVVPEADIDIAVVRKQAFSYDPDGHTFRGPMP
jgi:hypothetical protein